MVPEVESAHGQPETARALQVRLAKIERALELQVLGRPQAEIDSVQADAVAKLLTALAGSPSALVQIGSVLLIKVDSVPVVRTLSQEELAHMERNPALFRDPAAAFRELQNANRQTQPSAGSASLDHSTRRAKQPVRLRQGERIAIDKHARRPRRRIGSTLKPWQGGRG